MDEVWEVIPGYLNYSISSDGRVRNDYRGRVVKTSLTARGDVKVGLMLGGSQKTKLVSKIVAEVFVDGKTELFDTPIHLDGNKQNNNINNLVWRPHWFAWKYTKQFEHAHRYEGIGPLVDRNTGMVYDDILEAATTNGLLFYEVSMAVVNKVMVFPSWHIFDWINEYEN